MNLREIAAALKAKYRPVFRGDIEREAKAYRKLALTMQNTAEEVTGAGRAIASMTEGKGE